MKKNNDKIRTFDRKSNNEISVIPDAITEKAIIEIKDVKVVNNTKQIRGERQVAIDQRKELLIITGENTKVSKKIPLEEIFRRKDIGPQKIKEYE